MRIVSYALFTNHPEYGHRPLYWQCIPGVVRAHHNLFPGWEMRVHHDSSVDQPCGALLRGYADAGLVTLRYVEENVATCRSMLWRMRPCWDADADYVLCRDIDSLPSVKDRLAVEEFIASGMVVHALGDNPAHAGLMGGMIGFSSTFRKDFPFKSWDDFVGSYNDSDFPMHVPSGGPDQILINRTVAPYFSHETLIRNYSGRDYDGPATLPSDISEELATQSRALTPYLGAAGFDVAEAVRVFDAYGRPEVAARIKHVEDGLPG